MTRRRRFLALIATLFVVPAFAAGQSPYAPPPMPTGAPIAVPANDVRRASWLEDGPAPTPPANTPAMSNAAWPVQSGSACNFDCPDNTAWRTGEPVWSQVLAGAYFSSTTLGPNIPSFNYVPVTLRQGWYIGNPFGPNWLGTGYWEFVGDITGAAITSSYGSWFAGGALLFRYNWLDYGNPVVPYTQFGAGGILNDAYRDQNQRAVGELFEFYLHLEVGAKFFVAPNLSLDVEGGLQHISNARLASRNLGVNAFGGSIGFTYYFPWGCH
jgi:hypothetical protein